MTYMTRLACFALTAAIFTACKTKQQTPLVGSWKLAAISATPEAALAGESPVGAIYTFRADSTMTLGASSAPQRYELLRLPEGLFLVVDGSQAHRYRIIAMTPSELSLEENKEDARVNMQLEFQR